MVAFSGFRVCARNDSKKAPLSLIEEYREPGGLNPPAPFFPKVSHNGWPGRIAARAAVGRDS